MDTEELVRRLASDMWVVPRHALARRIGVGMFAGACVTFILVAAGLGIRLDLAAALQGSAFWMKWSYTASLGIGAVLMTARLSRPEPVNLARFWPVVLPFLALAVLSAVQISRAPAYARLAMWLGATWKVCPLLVFGLSVPIFVGLTWSFRGLAATRLRAAGATAGFASSAWSATLYCLHCPEVSSIFVLTWYTSGLLLATAAGAVLGPRVLRW